MIAYYLFSTCSTCSLCYYSLGLVILFGQEASAQSGSVELEFVGLITRRLQLALLAEWESRGARWGVRVTCACAREGRFVVKAHGWERESAREIVHVYARDAHVPLLNAASVGSSRHH